MNEKGDNGYGIQVILAKNNWETITYDDLRPTWIPEGVAMGVVLAWENGCAWPHGSAWLLWGVLGAPYLMHICVVDEFRRQGVATRMLQAIREKWPEAELTEGATDAGIALMNSFYARADA